MLQLHRFWKMLQKSITISREDKLRVEEELKMQYDWFIDTVPEVIERVEQAEKRGEARGEARGKVEGELQALRQVVLDAVQDRFPDLLDFAQSQVLLIKQSALLCKLIRDLQQVSDETAAIRAFKMAKQGA